MFLGNLPVKYNSEGVGTAATTPTNANPVNQTFVQEGGVNPPIEPTPPSSDIVDSDINTNLDVNSNKLQPYLVIAAALLIGLLVYRSLKKERTLQ